MKTKELIVVLGLDEKKKPHAAKFDVSQADAVNKAATAMGFQAVVVKDEEAVALADRLPPGKIFAAGKGMVAFCKAATYESLRAALKVGDDATDSLQSQRVLDARPDTKSTSAPDPWGRLKTGDNVIAKESDDLGWWPAVVTATSKDGQNLTLRWLDSKQPAVNRKRRSVALLPQ